MDETSDRRCQHCGERPCSGIGAGCDAPADGRGLLDSLFAQGAAAPVYRRGLSRRGFEPEPNGRAYQASPAPLRQGDDSVSFGRASREAT